MSNREIIIFLAGATIGSAIGWYLTKSKYQKIESAEEILANRPVEDKEPTVKPETKRAADYAKSKPDIMEYAARLQKEGYIDYAKANEAKDAVMKSEPYVITPDEFGEIEEYGKISLTYYSDGVLADELDEVVEDADRVVGSDFASHFGEYEADSVYVRNDEKKTDYEILLDLRTYEEAVSASPREQEVT